MAIKNDVQGVVLALFGASAGGHLAGLTATANATSLAALAGDLASSAGFILGKDLSTAAAFRDNMLTGLGISSTNAAYAAAKAWADGELAKPNANRGEIVASAVSFLAGLTDSTSPYYAVATAYKATVAAAVTWSEGAGATVFGVAALQAQQGVSSGGVGQTFTLQSVATGDTFVLTAGSDTVNGAAGTLGDKDTILDASSTDADVLNAIVSANNLKPRLQNVEQINITGQFVTTGLDLANTTGAKELALSTSITSGTGTVTNASTLNAAAIKAGANISTLAVTATASGTRDAVAVNAGAASTITLTGGAGADLWNLTPAASSTTTLATFGATDKATINLAGTTYNLTSDNAGLELNLVSGGSAANTVKATTGLAITTKVSGTQDLTIEAAKGVFAGTKGLSSTSTGQVDLKITDDVGAVADADLSKFVANTVTLANTGNTTTGKVIVNPATKLVLVGDGDGNVGSVSANLQNDTADLTTAGLNVLVKDGATAFTTGDKVDTLVMTIQDDKATEMQTITTLTLNAATTTLVLNGSDDLTIPTLTNGAALGTSTVVSAGGFTGKLKIDATAANKDVMILSGSGDDTIAVNGNSANNATSTIVYGGAGNDTISATVTNGSATEVVKLYGEDGNDKLTAGAAPATLDGGAGNDTLNGGAAVDTIVDGSGDDTINGGGEADKITVGVGNDKIIIDATQDADVITGFTVGEDKLILRGTITAGSTTFDVGAVTAPTDAKYSTFGTDLEFTLKGSTSTDLTDIIQFGDSTTAFTLVDDSTVTFGSSNDTIVSAQGTNVIKLGAGDDKITTDAGSTKDTIYGGAGNDTFDVKSTTATDIKDLSGGDIVKVASTALAVAATVTADWTATSASVNAGAANTAIVLTANNGINVDASTMTIADMLKGITIKAKAESTTGVTFKGTSGADKITGSDGADTLIGGLGADTITGGKGADSIDLTEAATAADTVTIAAVGDSGKFAVPTTNTISTTSFDVITGAKVGDKISIGTFAGGTDFVTTAVTGNDLSTITLADATAHVVRGTYTASSNTFVGSATGADELVIYDSTAATGTQTYEAVVLVGITGAVGGITSAGVITL